MMAVLISGCTATGDAVNFQSGQDAMQINVKADGISLTVYVHVDGQAVITHHYPVFVNSTDIQETEFKGHKIRSTLEVTRMIPGTRVQVNVEVDGVHAGEFIL
jgi:hypothetical protein